MATPNTDLIFKEFANGIRDVKSGKFYPFKSVYLSTNLDSKPNVRYFVKSISWSFVNTGVVALSSPSVRGYVDSVLTYLMYCKTPEMTQVTDFFALTGNATPSVLLDKESSIVVAGTYFTVVYAEVDDLA